jgi:hypothetical protein
MMMITHRIMVVAFNITFCIVNSVMSKHTHGYRSTHVTYVIAVVLMNEKMNFVCCNSNHI